MTHYSRDAFISLSSFETEDLHPYEDGMAEDWIQRQGDSIESGNMVVYAITLRYEATLVGAISLAINKGSQWGELGYWIGKPYWVLRSEYGKLPRLIE